MIMEQVRHIISGVSGETPKILWYQTWLINISWSHRQNPMVHIVKPQCLSLCLSLSFTFTHILTLTHSEVTKIYRGGFFPCCTLQVPLRPINNCNNDFPERLCLVFGIWWDPRGAVGFHQRVKGGVCHYVCESECSWKYGSKTSKTGQKMFRKAALDS